MSVAPTTSQPSALSEKTYCTENAASNFGLSAAGNIRQLHLNSDEFSLHNQVTTPPETRGTAGGDNIREQTNVGGKRTLSQSGEEKRQSYRSSGYGTGSSQGSADKTEVVTNDDVFEDLYSAPNTAGLSQEELTAKLRTNPQFYTLGVDNYNLSLGSTSSGGTLLDSASSFGDDGTLIPRLSILLNNSAVCSASRGNSQNTTQLQSSAEVHRKESSRQHSTTSGHSAMSSREVSFELQSWGAQSDDNESEPSVLPSSESSEASYREAVQQLWKYMTSQKESPNLTPSEDDVVTPPPHQVIPDPKTSLDTNMAHPVAQAEEERFQSVLDSFCSISVPSDQQVPQAVVDRMYRSAVWRIQRDAILKYLDSVKEEDTTSGVFEGLERLTFDSDHPSSSTELSAADLWSSDLKDLETKLKALEIAHCETPDTQRELTNPAIALGSQKEEEIDKELLLAQMQMAALCMDKTCPNVECLLGQEFLDHLETRLDENLTHESNSCQQMLRTIAWHAEVCEELKCPVPYCRFFQETDIPFAEQIARLQHTYYSYHAEITEPPSASDLFMKVCSSLPREIRPLKEGVDWSVVTRMGKFGQGPYYVRSSVYESSGPATSSVPFYWVVKKVDKNFHDASLVGMFEHEEKLREVDAVRTLTSGAKDYVIHLLWLFFQESHVFVCSRFEGASLADYVKLYERGMDKDLTFVFLRQLISATEFLHAKNILYLNWTCDHVVVITGDQVDQVKLCNFTTAVVCRSEIEDEDLLEEITLGLQPHVLAPELLCLSSAGHYSDVWGLGCIAYEMYIGYRVHNCWRHLDFLSQRSKMADNPVPNVECVKEVVMLNLLNSSFQIDVEKRVALSRLEALCKCG